MPNKSWVLTMLATGSLACVQVELQSIRNTGQITDYLTPSDEIEMSFGVGLQFYYTFAKDFYKYDIAALPSGAISFPCLSTESIWVQMNEIDTFRDDKTRVVLDCSWLQTTPGAVSINVYEDQDLKFNSASITKSSDYQ